MKTLLCLCAVLAVTFTLNAQKAAPAPSLPPLPPGPLLNKAPDYAQWTVIIQSGKPEPGASPGKVSEDAIRITTTKTGKIRHEVKSKGREVFSDVWAYEGMSVKVDPVSGVPAVAP